MREKAIDSILYGLKMGIASRRQLAEIVRRFHAPQRTIEVAPEELAARGITVLALDFDGVLAPHRDAVPLPEVEEWLRRCAAVLGEERIFILSNRPDPVRADYFRRTFPGVHYVSGVRKKPFPDGLLKIMELSGAVPRQVVMFDDRLLTGVLGACLVGVGVIYITAPYVSLSQRPLQEGFFMLLRFVERKLISIACRLSGK